MISIQLKQVLLTIIIFTLTGCGGGSSAPTGGNDTAGPAPTLSPTAEPPVTREPTPEPTPAPLAPDRASDPALPSPESNDYSSAVASARFLTQATFGPTAKSIYAAMAKTREQWIEEQFAKPQTKHLALLDARLAEIGFDPAPAAENDDEGWLRDIQRSDIWWESTIWGEDQLRQKVAYAISQILVISNVSDVLYNDSRGIANYHDILAEHAFGHYRDLLEAITLNPMMGEYLSMIRNEKADEQRNIRPDENYAREIMQLFSIGLVELNIDGTPKLNANSHLIPTYSQEDIKALARVFTGWNHATITQWWEWVNSGDSETLAMKPFSQYHDNKEKILFNNKTIPASQTPQADIDNALDILFAHNNIAPFISKQLIQHLVTSNPAPEYVERVATVFNNNGSGVKGDMKAVIKAILLDDEATNGHMQNPTSFGKLREPLLKLAAIWRAFKAQGAPVEEASGEISQNRLRQRATDQKLGQRPYGAFSVFNFYRPDYQQPGAIKDNNLLSPEFQIMTESLLVSATSHLGDNLYWRDTEGSWPKSEKVGHNWDMYPSQLYLAEEKAIASDTRALLNRINLLLMAGQMSENLYHTLLTFLNDFAPYTSAEMKIYDAIFLTVASPEFAVQR
ncbi:DUF1800 domain-containing protein [Teredinibacter haidensis]|uniref:DUF1800 domain-containing protein n=1 Tax=Teredinibacter haidensis TaxID=2731755 RepID=UPI000AD11080|nr:DUF1800 domain-containing protein [Teredinibacter haidensis]